MAVTNDIVNDSRVQKEAHTLARNGYKVTILGLLSAGLPEYENVTPFLDIIRIQVPQWSGLSDGWSATYNYFRHLLSVGTAVQAELFKRLRTIPTDVYHAHDLDTLWPCARAAREQNTKLVYDSHELFPDTITEFNKQLRWPKRIALNLIKLYYRWFERMLVNKTDGVIVVSNAMANALVRRYLLEHKPVIIRNCPELQPLSISNVIRNHLNLDDRSLIVLNQGGFGPGRYFTELIQSVKHLPPQYHLVFLGAGKSRNAIQSIVTEEQLQDRVHVIDAVRRDQLQEYTSSATVGVVLLENLCLNEQVALPNKVFEYLAAGLPVVSSRQIELQQVIEASGAGITLESVTPLSIAESIRDICENRNLMQISQKARLFAEAHGAWDKEEVKLLNMYRSIK